MNPTITAESYYCSYCDAIQNHHICTTCNDYNLTIDEAMFSGQLLALVPADCNCEQCTL